jgi:hypothetical protein
VVFFVDGVLAGSECFGIGMENLKGGQPWVGGLYVLYSSWGVNYVYGIIPVIVRRGDGSFVA